ncbi:hypothetical protein [Ornithinimicrobium cavernae]|uniref:hypothetical protein n=1 Tax=Ornithinimicrobium cavernae TaxID=2666047 RepID=UPI000D68BE4C|nr:hypothetical protein [Ornithinimicrobium cavernae]
MDDYELLLRHTESWAKGKKRPLDRDLLETTIGLRAFHDVTTAQEWPPGSVEHLMLVRWPSHGPSGEPDVEALIETLDTFWRFLRSTGRMRSGSAEPKELVKEARRAGAGMREACADPERHSMSKALMRFADEAGLSLHDAESEEELNARMQQVMEAFNNLPFEERDRWLPSPDTPGASTTPRMTELLQQVHGADAWDPYGGELDSAEEEFEEWDEFDDFDDEFQDFAEETWDLLPQVKDLKVQDLEDEPDTAVVAEEVRASAFIQQCLALARWVGEGKQVTATGVLRLAPAREVYEALDLWAWDLESRRHSAYAPLPEDLPPEAEDGLRRATLSTLRSAADAVPLDRLWRACLATGLIELGKTTARAAPAADPRHPRDEEQWADLGARAITSLVPELAGVQGIDPLLRVLCPFLRVGVDRVTVPEVKDWWWSHPANLFAAIPEAEKAHVRHYSDGWVQSLLWDLEDTGVWRREGETLHRTALGIQVATYVWAGIEDGTLRP